MPTNQMIERAPRHRDITTRALEEPGGERAAREMSGDQLRAASLKNKPEQLRTLLAGGANPCSVDDFGLTALHYAVWNGHIECVESLLVNTKGYIPVKPKEPIVAKRGQKVKYEAVAAESTNMQSKAGYSALHIAAQGGIEAEAVTKLLLLGGVDPNLKDTDGKTAAEHARKRGARDVLMVLEWGTPEEAARINYMAEASEKYLVQGLTTESKYDPTAGIADEQLEAIRTDLRLIEIEEQMKASLEREQKNIEPIRKTATAPELLMHENDILPFAQVNFERKERARMPIKNLVVALDVAGINLGRRDRLMRSREIFLREQGDNAAADMLALEERASGAFGAKKKEKELTRDEQRQVQQAEDDALAELEGRICS